MKKLLLVLGILFIIAGVLSLAFAALNMFGYYSVLDGSNSLYRRLHRYMIIFFIAGSVLLIIGIVLLILRSRITWKEQS